MNQQQRKYVTQRVNQIFQARTARINQEYMDSESRRAATQVHPQYPNYKDIVLKLAGFESPVVLKAEGTELETLIRNMDNGMPTTPRRRVQPNFQGFVQNVHYYPNPTGLQTLVYPLNRAEVDAYEAEIEASEQRHRTHVTDRIAALTLAYNRCMDAIMLGEYSEQIQAAIHSFENMEV
jgi:hypothetical protein